MSLSIPEIETGLFDAYGIDHGIDADELTLTGDELMVAMLTWLD
jgi:hypothetical protein